MLANLVITLFGIRKAANGNANNPTNTHLKVLRVYIIKNTNELMSIANHAPLLQVNTAHKTNEIHDIKHNKRSFLALHDIV